MRKMSIALVVVSLLSVQPIFAADKDMDSKPCAMIANACIKAGYDRKHTESKNIWKNCMKPIILGQKVAGATVDDNTVKSCRTDKIAKMKSELNDLENASK